MQGNSEPVSSEWMLNRKITDGAAEECQAQSARPTQPGHVLVSHGREAEGSESQNPVLPYKPPEDTSRRHLVKSHPP